MIAALALAGVCLFVLAAYAVAWVQAARRPRVLCLMYHRVASRPAFERTRGPERVFTVAEDDLDRQLAQLAATGHRFVDADGVAAFARGEGSLPDRSVLLSVDDGCASGYASFLPLLQRHGASAVFFVTTDPASAIFRLGEGERRMTDTELRALHEAGCSIGSHAVSHRPLSAMADEEIRAELDGSKRALEAATGAPVRHFAVPANWWDERVLRIAQEVGYETVFTSRPDTIRPGSGAFGLARVNVEGGLDLASFERAISPAGIARRRLVMALRGLPKRAMGPRGWTAVRSRLLGGRAGAWLSPARMARVLGLLVVVGLAFAITWILARG